MFKRILIFSLVFVAGVAAGMVISGENPIEAASILFSDDSTAYVGGYFGSIHLQNNELKLEVGTEHFTKMEIEGPNGWHAGNVYSNKGTYSFARSKSFPSGNYTVKAYRTTVRSGTVKIQEKTVYLQRSH